MKDRWLDGLRHWWTWHKQSAGLVIAALAFVAAALLVMPFTPGAVSDGTVVEFRKLGRKGGVEIYAVVEVSGQRPIVRLDAAHDCRIGSVVSVQKRRTLTGVRYSAPRGCRH
jgi:hypothetical protein